MELRHLRYFVAVAEERSFSRAAARLAIAQPPLSQQIRRLEKDLGYALFERSSRGVSLTRAGETLLRHARTVLAAAEEARGAADAAHRGAGSRLTIAFFNSAAYAVLPRLLRAFRDASPDVDVEIREMVIADQLDALLDERIDVGILRPPVADPRIATLALASEAFVLAVPADHALASRASVALRDLADQPFVAFPQGHRAGFRERIEAACKEAGVTPRTVSVATQIHTLCGLVAGGVGIAVVPAAAKALAIEGLRFVDIGSDLRAAEIWLGWRRQTNLLAVRRFVDAARRLRGLGVAPRRERGRVAP